MLSVWLKSTKGDYQAYIPFPVPFLLALYAATFIVAWVLFARRLTGSWRQLLRTAVVGSTPFFALCLLGYSSVVWMLLFGDFNTKPMLVAGVWIYGIISTLIFLAGVTGIVLVPIIAMCWSESGRRRDT